jgi:hypothetical protein
LLVLLEEEEEEEDEIKDGELVPSEGVYELTGIFREEVVNEGNGVEKLVSLLLLLLFGVFVESNGENAAWV